MRRSGVASIRRTAAGPGQAQARRIYLAAGATLPAGQIDGALGDRPARRAARPELGWAALTGTELRVAELVAAGLTNRSAASRLGISANTVGTHLRAVFAKLGVHSRVELANAVHERRRTGGRVSRNGHG